MPEKWVLDSGPFNSLAAELNDEFDDWPEGKFFLPGEVEDNAEDGCRRKVLDRAPDIFHPFEILEGTDAWGVLYKHLRSGIVTTNANLGEHQSIAWILGNDLDAVFVTTDKAAAYIALLELGRRRVAHPVDLWLWLEQQKLITESQSKALVERSLSGQRNGLPAERPWRLS